MSLLLLDRARAVAMELQQLLAPHCERIAVAGSVRRQQPEVKDLELVAIPQEMDFLRPGLDFLLETLRASGEIRNTEPRRWGPRYKAFLYGSCKVDLFIVRPPAQWGVIFAIRTGPAAYSQYLVTRARDLGMRVAEGALWRGREIWPTPEEADFFRALGLQEVPPEMRR